MKKIFPNLIVFSLISILVSLFAFVIVFAASSTLNVHAITKLPTIKTIRMPIATVNQNTNYKLPLKLTAILTNNVKKNIAVTWDKKLVYANTGIIGTSYYYGKVSGYNKKIKLALKVIPYIVSIKDINLKLKQNEIYPMPVFITAWFSDNHYKNMPVNWEYTTINTSKPATFKILGKTEGYSKAINLNIVVTPIITLIPDLNITLKQYESYSLPKNVQASYSDGSLKTLAVNWKSDNFTTAVDGKFAYSGNADGYDKQFYVNITILPVKIVVVNATDNNGSLKIKFSNPPNLAPVAGDFSLTRSVISSTAESSEVTIDSIAPDPTDSDSNGTSYIIYFKPLTPGFEDKSVTFAISYKNGSKLVSNSFLVPMVALNSESFDSKILDKQQFYNAIKYALTNFNESIELSIKDFNPKDYNLDMVDKVIYENPEIDYSYCACNSTTDYPDQDGYTKYLLKLKYTLSKEQMLKEKTAVNNKVKEVLANIITPGMTDYQKELAIHNYIIKNAKYDPLASSNLEPVESHNSYGVLILGVGVCESYAKALSLLFTEAGLVEKYVVGDANDGTGSVGHAWNMVRLDGEWYHVDATWDDPVMQDGTSVIRHDYFNVTDKLIEKDHSVDETLIDFPECTATKYYFFNMNGPEYDSNGNPMVFISNEADFKAAIASALDKRSAYLSLVLTNSNTQSYNLDKVIDEIISGRYTIHVIWYDSEDSADSNIKYMEIQFSY
jgi:hypothetical protein